MWKSPLFFWQRQFKKHIIKSSNRNLNRARESSENGADKGILRARKIPVYKGVHEFCEPRQNAFRCAVIRALGELNERN